MRLRRPRFSILTLMVVVAISAIVVSGFRPISQADAEKIAEARFLTVGGADRWIGHYRVDASPGFSERINGVWTRYPDGWSVIVSDALDGSLLAQYYLTEKGKLRAADFAPGNFNKLASKGFSVQ
jgi:hypothetical protein